MNIRVASLLFALVFAALPAHAQDQRGGLPALADRVAAMEARLDKLEGNIGAADLAGSYALALFESELGALIPGNPPRNAHIASIVYTGTVMLNADGTGSFDATGNASTLTQGPWTLTPDSGPVQDTFTWTFANSIVTITFISDGSEGNFSVGPSGRLLVGAFTESHANNTRTEADLLILTRLH